MEGLEDFIWAYLDDIPIGTKGSYQGHLDKVAEVLKRLQTAGFTSKPTQKQDCGTRSN